MGWGGIRRLAAIAIALAAMSLACVCAHAQPNAVVAASPPRSDLVDRWVPFREFNQRDGLLQTRVFALAQDDDGYIWAGSELGLSRYDARRWREVPFDPPLPRTSVNALRATADGSLWIGTGTRGLWRWHAGRFDAYGEGAGLVDRTVFAIDVDTSGTLWVGTGGGLSRCAGGRCLRVPGTDGWSVHAVLVGVDRDGRAAVWFGSREGGLRRVDDPNGSPHLSDYRLSAAEGLPGRDTYAIAQWGGSDGRDLWVGTTRGMLRIGATQTTRYDVGGAHFDASIRSFSVYADARGQPTLAAGSIRGGLLLLSDDGSWQQITQREGLPEDEIYATLVTRSGNESPQLWLGSSASGVLRLERDRWHAFDTRNGLPHRVVRGLGEADFPDGARAIWLGTLDGPVRWHGGRWERWLPAPFEHAVMFATGRAETGALWIASDNGLLHFDRSGVTAYDTRTSGLPSNVVLAVEPTPSSPREADVWLGTFSGLARLQGKTIRGVPEATPQRPGAPVRSLQLVEAAGTSMLFIGGDGGLAIGRDGVYSAAPVECIAANPIWDIRAETGAQPRWLWVGHDAGLTRIDLVALARGEWHCATLGRPDAAVDAVYQVVFGDRGRLYTFGPLGAQRLTPAVDAPDELSRMRVDALDIEDGLPSLEFNRAAIRDDRGRIWAGGIAGAAVYDPHEEAPEHASRTLRIASARALKSDSDIFAGEALDADDSDVQFELNLMSFHREQRTRYQVQLVGLNDKPVDWGDDSRWTFRRVPPGDYTLRAWARDADGVVSGPVELPFTIDTPPWRRPWMIAFVALAFAALIVAASRWRVRRLRQRAADLERQVDARTTELATANALLERASLTDALTGLYNRRYFNRTMPTEIERVLAARNADARIACVLLDLDRFKTINDTLGHAGGDAVLVTLGERLATYCGEHDRVLRWGGEEFLLVLRDVSEASAATRVANVLAGVASKPFLIAGRNITITCSIGYALYPWCVETPHAATIDHVLSLADQALYRAKEAGRNAAFAAICDTNGEPVERHPELRVRWVATT